MIFKKYKIALGKELARARHEKLLTQTTAAHRVGAHPQLISNIERGVTPPSRRLLRKMCKTYGLGSNHIAGIISGSIYTELVDE